MNRHFEDARYYLKRAREQVAAGVRAELAPVEDRVRAVTGREAEPEPTRTERIRAELAAMERRAGRSVRATVTDAREKLAGRRGRDGGA